MSRLTKEEILNFPKTTYGRALGKTIASKVMNELLQYKDLEEELGCPLKVFVKALKNGIYYDNKFEYPVFILDKDNFKTKNYNLLIKGTIVYLKDYKENWWLKKDRSE